LDEIISPENMGINKLDSLEKDCLKEVKIWKTRELSYCYQLLA
jgi:hypothetical protein